MASYLVVQISDVHLATTGRSLPPGTRPRDNLLRGLRLLEEAGIRPDILLLTGDLTDKGEGACYDDLRGIVADAASGSGASVIYVHQALGTLGAVPVWISPASAYRADTTSTQVFRGVPGTAFSRIDLSGDGPTVTVIPVPPEATV